MKVSSDVDQTNRDNSLGSSGSRVRRCNGRISLVGKKRRIRAKLGVSSAMPWHGVFAFLNPILIGVLQVKYQGFNNKLASPFEAHPAKMWSFISSMLVYCFAFAASVKCRSDQRIRCLSSQVALISGSLSSISLFSIFLPNFLGWLLLFAFFAVQVVIWVITTTIYGKLRNTKLWFLGNGNNTPVDQRLPDSYV